MSYKYLGHEIYRRRDNQTTELVRLLCQIDLDIFRQVELCFQIRKVNHDKKNRLKNPIQVSQRAMKRAMLIVSLRDKIRNREKRRGWCYRNIAILKWNWAGHVARMTKNRWTKQMLDYEPRDEAYRNRGGTPIRWTDDIKRCNAN